MGKSTPINLLKFKKCLTLPEAAKYLCNVCDEEVTEVDILKLALDRWLQLSIRFVNRTTVRACKMVQRDQNEIQAFHKLWESFSLYEQLDLLKREPQGISIGNGDFLITEDKCTYIEGVWDLPLIGDDRHEIERLYQEKTGGCEYEMWSFDGAFITSDDGVIYQLQERISEQNSYSYHQKIMKQIDKCKRLELNPIKNRRKDNLIILRREKLKKLKGDKHEWDTNEGYISSGNLLGVGDLVIRIQALREFELKLTKTERQDLSETEQEKLLKQIGALALLLSKKINTYRKSSDEPNISQIAIAVDKMLGFLPDANIKGLSNSSLRASITESIALLHK